MDHWRGLLEAATVALDLPGGTGGGTGFVVSPGTVVTCAHVVAGADTVRGRITATGHEFTLTVSDAERHRAANGLDIAFLRFDTEAAGLPHVLASTHMSLGDRMWVYGHPRGDYRAGQWAAVEYQGDSRLTFDDPMPMPRGYGTPVGEGFSGSPVVNERTGAVCGMLARSNKAGSTHMVPLSQILARCPAPAPAAPVEWLDTLTDEQVRAGRFRHPGPVLRDYLTAARDAADEHPYATLLSDAGHIPLSTVYVRQEAAHTEHDAVEGRGHRTHRKDRPDAESVLDDDRHVLFTGGAGAGKSSLLRRLTFTTASAWLADPAQAPPYVPVRVTAGQLLGRPFPEAVADAVGRDLPGLRRSLPPESFETGPMPSVEWLVCVDGLDEVLDPDDRGRVIRVIQRWSQEPSLRFVVASRSLVTAEMDRLHALARYTLLELGDQEIAGVARAWFVALKVPDAEREAARLAAGLRRGRLSEVARNPLYLTMICVVAAVHELPRNPAELYAKFIGILREKGSQRLRRSDPYGHGITPALLERVHDVLPPVAELRQSGDSRPLLDQVLDLLLDRFPDGVPAQDVVLRALTFTGLVTRRDGALSFLHHTVQEYLAAQSLAERLNPKEPEALRTVREAIGAERPNLVLFMVAHWHEQGMPLEEFVRAVVHGGGWRELLLCATILSDELVNDEELTARFTRAVLKLHGWSVQVGDLTADTVLDRLYAVLDTGHLRAVVRDPTVPHQPRLNALRHCVRRGDDRAGALAAELADETDFPTPLRVEAAELLAESGERSAACRRLTGLAQDADHVPESRLQAADALRKLDPSTGTAVLGAILSGTEFPEEAVDFLLTAVPTAAGHETWTSLADALARNPELTRAGPHMSRFLVGRMLVSFRPELLDELARDSSAPLHLRDRANAQLVTSEILGDPEASDDAVVSAVPSSHEVSLIERAARAEHRSTYTRVLAIKRLIEIHEHSLAADCVDHLLVSLKDAWTVPMAADLLRELGQPARSRRLLLDASGDRGMRTEHRLVCVVPLIALGASEEARTILSGIAADTDIAAHDRLSAINELREVDPAAADDLLAAFALDDKLPGGVRRDAARRLLKAGKRDTASSLLRHIAEDPFVSTSNRIDALTTLAEIDLRATSETLHRILDESGLTDEHLWGLLDLADALTPDVPLRRRADALLDDEAVPADVFLRVESEHCVENTAILPLLRRALSRTADDPTAEASTRAAAVERLLGLVPYPRWRARMAEVGVDPLHSLSLHLISGGRSFVGIYPKVWAELSFSRDHEDIRTPTGALAGVDPHAAADQWAELVAQRRPEAVTRLRYLINLIHDAAHYDPVHDSLLAWAADPDAPLSDRIAAAATGEGHPEEGWFALALDAETPVQLRVEICEVLPTSGEHNRIPLVRALAADAACPVDVRAKAAALLAEDVGEEGRRVLRDLSGPHTDDREADLAVGAAWDKLGIGDEAVSAYSRVLDDERTDARHRVTAAARLARWPAARGAARQALNAVLDDLRAPVSARIEAAENLIRVRASAEAHLGLLRLAVELEANGDERARVLELLPADLRTLAERAPTAADETPHPERNSG